MYTVRYGGGRGPEVRLVERKDLLVVRTAGRGRVADAPLSRGARKALDAFEVVARFETAGVEVLRARGARGAADARDFARRALRRESAVEFAGRALADPVSGRPVVYTENFFVKTRGGVSDGEALRLFERFGLRPKRRLDYAAGAWFVSAPRNTGREVFAIAERLLGERAVELCHPELVRETRRRAAFREQWHLKKTVIGGKTVDAHANVEAAWAWSEGEGVTVAVIDDGVDLDHEEFRSPGKIVSPRDVTLRADDARPGTWDHHGTACAGVACADGRHGASG
ncbi:MAG: S8 family serine peptidase, partial [Planctomycetota bacterium]